MTKEKKLGFRDLSWFLKGAAIGAWIYLVLVVLNLGMTLWAYLSQ